MFPNLKSLIAALLITFISGCSSLGWLKFWGDEEEVELPASLEEINQVLTISELWSAKLGKSDILGRITPSFSGNTVFYVNSEGTIFAFNVETGKSIWTKETEDEVSGGIESKFKRLIYGTLDGEVVVLEQDGGSEIWRSRVTGEILSSPVTDGSVVVAQASDGSVTGFDLRTGIKKWIHKSNVPNLSLRGTATPIISQGFIFTGFANGTIAMIYPDSGAIRLDLPVTINEGTSELERIIDIDGKSVVASDILVSASYQGDITAIDLLQGRPVWQEKISTIILTLLGVVLVVDGILERFFNIGIREDTLVLGYCIAFIFLSIKFPNLLKNKYVIIPMYIMVIQTFYSLIITYI